jgi:serine phosphatase RsbU (regulator of sigma subunit)
MFRSLKAKLVISFGLLIVVLFSVTGLYLVDAKERELTRDINESIQVFSRLTGTQVVKHYGQFFEPGNFISFRREIYDLLQDSVFLDQIALIDYVGEKVYDSVEDDVEAYSGEARIVDDATLERVQARNSSLLLDDGRVIYLTVGSERQTVFVNENEEIVDGLDDKDRIVNAIAPVASSFGVVYGMDYGSLDENLFVAKVQIVVLALIGLVLALMLSYMISVSITNPLKLLKEGADRIAKRDFSVRVSVKGKDEVGMLASTFNKMAEDLEASTEAMLYKERVQKELELAAQMQQELLPDEELETEFFDVSGGLVPATEVGGDAFDYIEMNDGRHLIYLGDVTGHGVAAGIVSSIANAMLYAMKGVSDLRELIARLNDVMLEKTTMKVFMTMALILWDEKKSTAYYVNAGHPPVLYYDSGEKKVTEVKVDGIALGLSDQLSGSTNMQKIRMKPNDVLVIYSDGVPEAVNLDGVQYGMQKLRAIVQDAANDLYTAKGIKNAILADVVQYIGEEERKDDMTVVVLKKKG